MKTKVVGCLAFLLVLIAGFLSEGDPKIFINLPGIAFVVVAAVGLALARYRKGDGKSEIIENLKRYSILSGVIGCLIGFVQIGWHVSEPRMLPMAIAVPILTIIYGLILYCIFDAFTENIRA